MLSETSISFVLKHELSQELSLIQNLWTMQSTMDLDLQKKKKDQLENSELKSIDRDNLWEIYTKKW